MPYVDLHLHTNFSDGTDTPREVVERGALLGFAAIAITDHDTVDGLDAGNTAARKLNLEFMNGVEISSTYGNIEIHVLGLGIDPKDPTLLEELENQRAQRDLRAEKMIARINEIGFELTRDEVEAGAKGPLGRMHVAMAMQRRGYVKTNQEAFDKYLKRPKRAYVPRKMPTCRRAIEVIHSAGGAAILAHPGLGTTVSQLIPRLLTLPFDGLEVYHTKHTPGQVTQFTQIALEHDLLITGGSDCHGDASSGALDMGKVRVPYHHFEVLKQALEKGLRPRPHLL